MGAGSSADVSLAHAAEVYEQRGDVANAALSFQRALALDEKAGDARSAASDWFNYAQFLRRQGQPERLVFACLLKSGDFLSATPGEELTAVTKAQQESEARLGNETQTARTHSAKLVTEALSLPPTTFSSVSR